MKKILALMLALVMVLCLVACGGDTEDPSGDTGKPDDGPNIDIPEVGVTRVETKSDRVVTTLNDGLGSISVTEYIFDGDTLSEIVMTMHCANNASAKALYDSYITGDMKEYAEGLYIDIKLDGKKVIHTLNADYQAAFAGLTKEQLAIVLDGGTIVPDTGGSDGESDSTLQINTAWEDLNLPEGFPKLADGVTSFSEIDGSGIVLNWNAMTIAQVEAMLAPLEAWAGAEFQAFGDDTYMNWTLDTDAYSLGLGYFAEPVAMIQFTLNIYIW